MKKTNSVLVALLLSAVVVCSQTVSDVDDDRDLQKAVLLSEVKTLALEIPKLDSPLARARAGAEIADAAWTLDRGWAKSLLKQAFQLTYLTEEEQRQIGPEPPGTPPRPPNALTSARTEVRKRILGVARRDRAFVDQLLTDNSARLTKDDRQMMSAQMTLLALADGDIQAAISSIEQNIVIDPTQLMLVQLINDLARKDRSAADKLILHLITNLSNVQLAGGKQGRARGELVLRWIVFPNSFFPDPDNLTPIPGAEVMRAYTRYVGEDISSSMKDHEELYQQQVRKKETEALSSGTANEQVIESAIARGEFETARKLIDKLAAGEQKTQLTEKVNVKEAFNLARKGDLLAAQNMAEGLTTLYSLAQVYPLIVHGYAANKDQVAAAAVVHQAVRQLDRIVSKSSDSPVPTLAKLAGALLPVDVLLAAEIVDDIVARTNRRSMDTTQGRTGIDSDLFKSLAAKDEVRARSAAHSFKDRLQRVVALAVINHWKATELERVTQKTKL